MKRSKRAVLPIVGKVLSDNPSMIEFIATCLSKFKKNSLITIATFLKSSCSSANALSNSLTDFIFSSCVLLLFMLSY
jgi:hypothetical protein